MYLLWFAHAPTRSFITLLYPNGLDSVNADRTRILTDTPIDPLKGRQSGCLLAYSQASTQKLKLTNWLLILTKNTGMNYPETYCLRSGHSLLGLN